MSRVKIFWTRQAQDDLREIRAFIARDAPITAASFVHRLRRSVDRLRTYPMSGPVVPEIDNPEIREVICGHYRLIYRFTNDKVEILTVFHGARLLGDADF
jgi:toxin ParE1/3/4